MGLGKTYSADYLIDSNGNGGVSGQVLISTATGIDWSDGSSIIGGPFLPLSGGTMTGTGEIRTPDNFKLKVGTAGDMEIYHNATNTLIDNQTGNLLIQTTSGSVQINKGTAENMAEFITDGAVKLYYDSARKFETTNTGVTITGGWVTNGVSVATANVEHTDNTKSLFGNGNDLAIYHDGSNSYIDDASGTGSLYINTNALRIVSANKGENMIRAFEDGGVVLSHNNVDKLQTTTDGITIGGKISLNGKITGLIAGTANTDAVNLQQLNDATTGALIFKGTWAAGTTGVTNAAISTTTITLTTAPTNAIAVGDIVTADGITAVIKVTAVASQTSVTVDAAVTIATGITVTFSPAGGYPDLTQASLKITGNYYICETAGVATPNGASTTPNEWAVGDWVAFSDLATDAWQKIDNSSVLSGAGTGGSLAAWSGSGTSVTLQDAPATFSGDNTTFAGSINMTDNKPINYGGQTMFTHTGSQTRIGDNTSSNVLTISGGNATFTGNVSIAEKLIHTGDTNTYIQFADTNDKIVLATNGSDALTIDASQAATFAGKISSVKELINVNSSNGIRSGGFEVQDDGDLFIGTATTAANIVLATGNSTNGLPSTGTARLTVNSTGATFAGNVFARRGSFGTASNFGFDLYVNGNAYINDLLTVDDNATFAGSVGIGTTSPGQKLSVQGDSTAAAGRFTAGGNTNTLELFGNSTTGQSSGLLVNAGTNTADYSARFRNAAGSVIMNIRGDGNVGIGTTNPSEKLHVASTAGFIATFQSTTATDFRPIRWLNSAGQNVGFLGNNGSTNEFSLIAQDRPLRFGTGNGGAERMRITSAGDLVVNGTAVGALNTFSVKTDSALDQRWQTGVAHNQHLGIITGKSNGFQMIQDTSDNLTYRFHGGTNNAILLDASTDGVGIGTTSPVGKLFVGPTWSQTGGNDLYIKSATGRVSFDPTVNNTQDLGITYNTSSTTVTGPDKVGLVLHNDAGVAGEFSPMIIFSGREATPSQFKAAMAGIYARSPLGTGNSNSYIDGELIFATAGAATEGIVQRMVINKEGNVGIGTTSPSTPLQVNGIVQVKTGDDTAFYEGASVRMFGSQSYTFRNSPGQTRAIINVETSGVNAGNLSLYNASTILTTKLNNGGASYFTGGGVLIGKTADDVTTQGVNIQAGGAVSIVRTNGAPLTLRRDSSNVIQIFRRDATLVGRIDVTTNSTSYGTSSDYRLKEDLQDFNGLDIISKIKMYNFKWKNEDERSYGVVAHELQAEFPQAVAGNKDDVEMQGVDYSKLVPLLVKSVQELTEEIKLLKQQINK